MASEEDLYSYAGPSSGPSVSQHRVLPYNESLVRSPYSPTFAWQFRLRSIECDQWMTYSGSILPDTYYTCEVASTPGVSMACVLLLGDGLYDWTPCALPCKAWRTPYGTYGTPCEASRTPIVSETFLSYSGSNSYKFMNTRLPSRIIQRGDQYDILQDGTTTRVQSKGWHPYFADISFQVRWSSL